MLFFYGLLAIFSMQLVSADYFGGGYPQGGGGNFGGSGGGGGGYYGGGGGSGGFNNGPVRVFYNYIINLINKIT